MNIELLISLIKVASPLGTSIVVGRHGWIEYKEAYANVFTITILEYPTTPGHIGDFFTRYVTALNENGFVTNFSRDNCGLFINKELGEQVTISRPTMIYDFRVEIKPFPVVKNRPTEGLN